MDTTKNKVWFVICAIIIAIITSIICLSWNATSAYGETNENESIYSEEEKAIFYESMLNGTNVLFQWKDEGYGSYKEWSEALSTLRLSPDTKEAIIDEYNEYVEFDDEDLAKLDEATENQKHCTTITAWNKEHQKFEEFQQLCSDAKQAYEEEISNSVSQSSGTSNYSDSSSIGLSGSSFKSQGVVYYGGMRYTYYSSNVLRHYRTSEWTADENGFYRDSDGYYVVASDSDSFGGIVETPWGAGKVYDTGAGYGTRDMYVNY